MSTHTNPTPNTGDALRGESPDKHSSATAVVRFRGLTLFCLNRDTGQWEIGLLRHPAHQRSLKIYKVDQDGGKSEVPLGKLSMERDIRIDVIQPAAHDLTYEHGHFDRRRDEGEPDDFRWLLDLEGPELHGKHLTLKPTTEQPGQAASPFQRVLLSDACFYSGGKSLMEFARVKKAPPPAGQSALLGKVAEIACADLICLDKAGSAVVLMNDGHDDTKIELPKTVDVKGYEIEFENMRPMQQMRAPSGESDFVLFYSVLADPDGIQYDLHIVTDDKDIGSPIDDSPDDLFNGPHIVCDPVYLSKTTSLAELL